MKIMVRTRFSPGRSRDFVKLHAPDWTFDPEELAAAFTPATKAIILNTPNNPTGKVFTRPELEKIRDLCVRWNAFAITDEIYEHMLYDGAQAHLHGHFRWHARTYHHNQRALENV